MEERKKSRNKHVIPAKVGISDTPRHNKKQDARLREHDKQLGKNKFRTYSAVFLLGFRLLPIFRPDGAS